MVEMKAKPTQDDITRMMQEVENPAPEELAEDIDEFY